MNKYIKWILGAAVLVFVLVFPFIVSKAYHMHIALMIGIHILLALSLNLVTGYCGQLSIGHAAFYGVGAYTSALLTLTFPIPFWVAFFIAAIVSAFFGLLLGLPTLRLKGAYLVISTLGFGEIIRLILLNWIDVTRGPMGITGIKAPDSIFGLDFANKTNYYYLMVLIIAIVLILMRLVTNSRTGRAWIAIREDQLAAEVMGIHLAKYKLIAFVASAFVAGFTGSLYAHYVRFISPDTFVLSESIAVVIMVLIGGMGTLVGPIIGAIGITYLLEALRDLGQWRMVLYGLILFFCAVYLPKGLMGLYNYALIKIKSKREASVVKANEGGI